MFTFPPSQLDFNECDDKETNNCHEHATCINKPGSFECECKDGYRGDGTTNCGKTIYHNLLCRYKDTFRLKGSFLIVSA